MGHGKEVFRVWVVEAGRLLALGQVGVGPPIFGLVLDAAGSYRLPWLGLGAAALLVAVALSRLRPLVQRG